MLGDGARQRLRAGRPPARRSRSRSRSARCARACRTPSTAASAARATTRGGASPASSRTCAPAGARRRRSSRCCARCSSDPRLELRFWLPESELYVDARGRPVEDAAGATNASERRSSAPGRRSAWSCTARSPTSDRGLLEEVVAGGRAGDRDRPPAGRAAPPARRGRGVARRGSSRRATRSAGGSNATSTTAPSSGWSSIGLALRHAQHELGPPPAAPARRARRRPSTRSRSRSTSCASSRAASGRRSSTTGWRRRSASWPPAPRCPSRCTAGAERFPDDVEAAAYFIAARGSPTPSSTRSASRIR